MKKNTRQVGRFPIGLHVTILKRFMSEKDLETLYESYKNACLKRHRMREISPLDRKIFKDYKAGATFSELQDSYQKSRNFILYSVALAARQ